MAGSWREACDMGTVKRVVLIMYTIIFRVYRV